MKNAILGSHYSLSVAFVDSKEMQRINGSYGKRRESTDVLSFPLGRAGGELIFSLSDVERKSADFGMKPREYFRYLIVHSLVHLKGFDHGRKMDALEKRFCRRFKIAYPSDFEAR